jgi:hypothetical protein
MTALEAETGICYLIVKMILQKGVKNGDIKRKKTDGSCFYMGSVLAF